MQARQLDRVDDVVEVHELPRGHHVVGGQAPPTPRRPTQPSRGSGVQDHRRAQHGHRPVRGRPADTPRRAARARLARRRRAGSAPVGSRTPRSAAPDCRVTRRTPSRSTTPPATAHRRRQHRPTTADPGQIEVAAAGAVEVDARPTSSRTSVSTPFEGRSPLRDLGLVEPDPAHPDRPRPSGARWSGRPTGCDRRRPRCWCGARSMPSRHHAPPLRTWAVDGA